MDNDCIDLEQEMTPHQTWGDFILYLLGGLGLFFFFSVVIGHYFNEINLTVTTLVIISNLVCIGGSVIMLGIVRKRISWVSLGVSPNAWHWEYVPIAASLALGIIPFRVCAGVTIEVWAQGGLESLQSRNALFFSGGISWLSFVVIFIGIGILAPISEEMYFRGLIYKWLKQRWGVPIGVVISSLLFGVAHLDSIAVAVSALIMGVVLALAYERTKSLYMPIAIHIITNTFSVLLAFFMFILQEQFPSLLSYISVL